MRIDLRPIRAKKKLRVYRHGKRTPHIIDLTHRPDTRRVPLLIADIPKKKRLVRLVGWILIFSMNTTGLAGVGETAAYFYDTEVSDGNTFIAGLVDFELHNNPFTPTSTAINLMPGTSTSKYIDVIPNALTNPFFYYASSSDFSLDIPFCKELLASMAVTPSSGTTTLYSEGSLTGLFSATTTEIAPWYLSLSLPATSTIVNAVCEFYTDFNGWQTRHDFPKYDDGFSDTETVHHRVSSWGLRINKIYHDVDESEDRVPKECKLRSPGYWVNHEGCTGGGNGSSNWTSQINAFSGGFSGVFASTTGSQICQQENSSTCPTGSTYSARLCRAKRHLLANELNAVSGKLDLDAIIAGSDNGNSAFDALGLTPTSTIRQTIMLSEQAIMTSSSTALLSSVATAMERVYTFYEHENPNAPMCIYESPKDPGRGHDPANEWVELYNQTNVPISLNGLLLCDGNACDTLSATTSVPAGGYAVVTGASSTWNYWQVPGSIVKVVLSDGTVGDALDDDAEMLYLSRADGVNIDQMNYGTTTPSWPNANVLLWDPAVPDAPQGTMLGRKPNGYDTDQPSDWHQFVPPYAQLIYPTPYESGINWNWNTPYDITWLATNQNGPDSALLIDLHYVEDVDRSTSMTTADRITPIVLNTQNDGTHTWTTPSGFIGWVWVKLTARGPENPMITTTVVSGRMYDPPAPANDLWGVDQSVLPEPVLTEEEMALLEGENTDVIDEESQVSETESASTTEEITEPTIPEESVVEEYFGTGITTPVEEGGGASEEGAGEEVTEENVASSTQEVATSTEPHTEEDAAPAETESNDNPGNGSPLEQDADSEGEENSPEPEEMIDESTLPATREEDTQPEDPAPEEGSLLPDNDSSSREENENTDTSEAEEVPVEIPVNEPPVEVVQEPAPEAPLPPETVSGESV